VSESLREAVEGFERDVTALRALGLPVTAQGRRVLELVSKPGYFTRADVLDLATAANDARQLAIAQIPKQHDTRKHRNVVLQALSSSERGF